MKRIKMSDKISGVRASYQLFVSNILRGFVRGCGDSCSRSRGCEFNWRKPKIQGKCKDLGSELYSIGDA